MNAAFLLNADLAVCLCFSEVRGLLFHGSLCFLLCLVMGTNCEIIGRNVSIRCTKASCADMKWNSRSHQSQRAFCSLFRTSLDAIKRDGMKLPS